jgi:hypothetical protein
MVTAIIAFLLALFGLALPGCGPNSEAIERSASKGFEVANAALQKALQETSTRTAQLQGDMKAVEPGWVVRGYGIFGTGLVYEGQIFAKGVSGGLSGATQADQGQAATVSPPVLREGEKATTESKPTTP